PVVAMLRTAASHAVLLSPARRQRLFALVAAHLGLSGLMARCQQNPQPGTPVMRWAHTLGTHHQRLTGHTGRVYAVAVGRVGGRAVIVSGSGDATVQVWDPATGQTVGAPLTAHTSPVSAVAVGRIGDRDIIVSGSHDRTVRVWDAVTGQPVCTPQTVHT